MKQQLAIIILLLATWCGLSASVFAATSISNTSAFPATITFSATDPEGIPTVGGSSNATITWRTTGGSNTSTWTLQVQSTAATFASCPSSPPATQVTVNCVSVTPPGAGGGTGACAGSGGLSTALRTVASGIESSGNNRNYTVVLSFTFSDSWSFIAAPSCTLGLSYLITAN